MKKVPYLIIFAIAMGYLEAAVVVYLRELFYPEGFHFPITIIREKIAIVEIARELSTIVLMTVPAFLFARTLYGRLAAFSLLFGVWDIFYYIWLKIAIDWPASLMTWDILFLIPVPWVGPVLAPLIVSVCLIAGALTVICLEGRGVGFRGRSWEWILAAAGAAVVVLSFTFDFQHVIETGAHGVFRWPLLVAGLAMGWLGFGSMTRSALRRRAGEQATSTAD